eukprot:TRINITY_DN1388_c0_g1_i7.p1 TRINITY_DN1388_c0_g1~~TRINITY_DN1388_c0_g1_i7.p1  ORF type:complete len:362 (-),score=101.68 TRINITY_DN1388_c0_g1_i7:808-1893(-)
MLQLYTLTCITRYFLFSYIFLHLLIFIFFFFLMIRRPPRSTLSSSSAASDVYKRQVSTQSTGNRLAMTAGISSGVLDVFEAERLVESIKATTPTDVGSKQWLAQHRALDRLNVQAHHNVVSQTDEFVVEAMISFEKLPIVVHELILIETWKHMCMPKLQEDFAGTKSAIKPYLMMYHEAVLCNLLECSLFSLAACEAVGDIGIVELVDYCTRKCTYLNSLSSELVEAPHKKMSADALKDMVELETGPDLDAKRHAIEFSCAMTAMSILRFITDHMNNLEMSVMSRLINPNDVPMQLVPLLQNAPWNHRTGEGEIKVTCFWVAGPICGNSASSTTSGRPWMPTTHSVSTSTKPKCGWRCTIL